MDTQMTMIEGRPRNQWEYFEYGVDLVLVRWTALRMATEGNWGGGDTQRKKEIFREEILNLFKYKKNVYLDDLAANMEDFCLEQFHLECEDGSIDQVAAVLIEMADECKQGRFDRIVELEKTLEHYIEKPIDLKKAKVHQDEGINNMDEENNNMVDFHPEPQAEVEDTAEAEDGWAVVRKSSRKKKAPQMFDPMVEFPGAQ